MLRSLERMKESSEGRVHCRSAIGIEIPTVKLQKNQGRILSVDIVLGKILDHQIMQKPEPTQKNPL
jgi:hypothetical protein